MLILTTKKLSYALTEIASKSIDPQLVGNRKFSMVSTD